MRIAFLGDIALIGKFSYSNAGSMTDRISYLKKILEGYDYIVANLESPLTNKKKTIVPKSMHLRSDEKNVKLLKLLGVNAVSLANNHMFDFEKKGLDDTIRVLEHAGIKWYGAYGKNLIENVKGEKISISGFCCYSTNAAGYSKSNKGINVLTYSALKKQLQKDAGRECFSILSLHWGIEHTNYPALEHIKMMKALSSEYRFIIHGHHPHQIQGVQNLSNSLIAYSLGNAIFDKCTSINGDLTVELNEHNRRSFVLGVEISDGNILQYTTEGFYIANDGIEPYSIDEELIRISNDISDIVNESAYRDKREQQYSNIIMNKFGKHDYKWFMSRLNYFAVGAKIIKVINSKRYAHVFKTFLQSENNR